MGGALVRHNEPRTQVFNGRFYGDDAGYNAFYNHLSVPLCGIIHEVNQNGLYAILLRRTTINVNCRLLYKQLKLQPTSTKFYFENYIAELSQIWSR